MPDPAVVVREVQVGGALTIRDVRVGLDEDKTVAKLVEVLEARGVLRTGAVSNSTQGGLEQHTVIRLAQRLKPEGSSQTTNW